MVATMLMVLLAPKSAMAVLIERGTSRTPSHWAGPGHGIEGMFRVSTLTAWS